MGCTNIIIVNPNKGRKYNTNAQFNIGLLLISRVNDMTKESICKPKINTSLFLI
jgi:hypothetical protein